MPIDSPATASSRASTRMVHGPFSRAEATSASTSSKVFCRACTMRSKAPSATRGPPVDERGAVPDGLTGEETHEGGLSSAGATSDHEHPPARTCQPVDDLGPKLGSAHEALGLVEQVGLGACAEPAQAELDVDTALGLGGIVREVRDDPELASTVGED